MTNYSTPITCPECGHDFPASEAFQSHIKDEAKRIASSNEELLRNSYEKKLHEAQRVSQEQLDEKANELADRKLAQFSSNLKEEKKRASELELELHKSKTDLESFKETRDADIELAIAKATAQTSKTVSTSLQIKMRELTEENNKLKRNINSLQTGSDNKSSQLLGEAGETYLETKLIHLFPHDLVHEIRKGENGADCMWTVRSNGGKQISTIYCEAKNTQNFQSSWIPKLKNDMMERSASLGILVTKTMPKDSPDFHFREGILVCNFYEFDTIVQVLRYHQLELFRQASQNLAKETKANQLFDFIVGTEFARSIEKILRPVFEQKKILEKEMRSIRSHWKVREKLIQESIDGAGYLAAGLQVNLGAEVTNKIGFEEFELLEIVENEEEN